MHAPSGHGMLSRVRSHRKLRTAAAAEDMEAQSHAHRRQHSDSATRTDIKGHWPPIEWDPLKLNPPVAEGPAAPARLQDRQPLQNLRTKRSFAGHENRRPPRLHHSDSGFSFDAEAAGDFDFALEKAKALRIMRRSQHPHEVADMKGWPSPASSVDSGKSWFEDDDDDDDDNDDGAVARGNEIWEDAPSPRRRPQVGSPDDPGYFMKRGAWKRRGIFFGMQSEEMHKKEDDAFDV